MARFGWRAPAALAVLSSVLLAACGSGSGGGEDGAEADELGLLSPGSVSVAYTQGFMPYIGEEDGALAGAEGDMFTSAAADLGLDIEVSGMEFSAFLAGIQAGRYDVGIGGVSWSAERAESGAMSDPVYYSPVVALSRPGIEVTTVSDLEGLSMGALAGSTTEQALRTVVGGDLTSYPTSAAAFADLEAGRLDSLVIDPLLNAYMRQTRPDLTDFVLSTLEPPGDEEFAAYPGLADGGLQPYAVVWYCAPHAEALCDSLSEIIRGWYEDGTSAEILAEYGVDDPAFFTARERFQGQRQGVDRPEDWTAPTAGDLIVEE